MMPGKLERRTARRTVTVGAIVLVFLAAVGYLAATAHRGAPWARTTVVQAAFTDVHSLKSGDQVRQNSIRIGRVDDIRFDNDVAVVTMRLDGRREVYRDARAAVGDFSSLGTKFIELHPGRAESGALGENETIPAERNVDSSDIYELFNVFDDGTRRAATSAVRELGSGAGGLSRELHDYLGSVADLLGDAGTVSRALASEEADLPTLLNSAHRLSARFTGRERQITDLLTRTDATLRAVSVDSGNPLRDTLRSLPSTLDSARDALDRLADPLARIDAAAGELRPGAKALGASADDLRGVLREGVRPLERVPGVAEPAGPAVKDLTRTFADARPLAPTVTRALQDLVTPMQVLAPYAPEVADFLVAGHSFLAEDVNGLHYARIGLVPGIRTAGGLVAGRELIPHNYYPEPGEAKTDRAGSIEGGR